MNTRVLFDSAERSLASYSTLVQGETALQTLALQASGNGLSLTQAADFATRYPTIITQYNDITALGGMGTGFNTTVR